MSEETATPEENTPTAETAAETQAPPPPEPAPRPAAQPVVPTPAATHRHGAPGRPPLPDKVPFLAAALSGFLPGLGNIYNGLYGRAVLIILVFVTVLYTAVSSDGGSEMAFLAPALAFVWFFNIFDAYRQATLINYGLTEEDVTTERRAGGGLAAGVALVVIGIYGMARQYLDIELLELLADNWYLIVLLAGIGLIANTVMQQRKAEAAESSDEES